MCLTWVEGELVAVGVVQGQAGGVGPLLQADSQLLGQHPHRGAFTTARRPAQQQDSATLWTGSAIKGLNNSQLAQRA